MHAELRNTWSHLLPTAAVCHHIQPDTLALLDSSPLFARMYVRDFLCRSAWALTLRMWVFKIYNFSQTQLFIYYQLCI